MNSIVFFGVAIVLIIVLMRTIKIVPQKQVKIIERLGKYHRTAEAGLNTVFPFFDSVRETIDLREQITKIEPQPVITRDNVTMEVDAVIYSVIVDPVRATYEVQNLLSRLGGQGVPSRTDPLIGRHGQVTDDIDPTIGTGRINVAGQDWAARSQESLPTGTRVRVVAADGIVLEVTRA